MTRDHLIAVAAVTAAVLYCAPGASAQNLPPGTAPNLDRRVFIDVNQAAPGKVLAEVADAIPCELDADRKLPQPDISLRLSNVRARTALDAVCDMIGCRWELRGRTLKVTATAPPPAVPVFQMLALRMKAPLTGSKWRFDRVPLGTVLGRLSDELGLRVGFDGVSLSTPVSVNLEGQTPADGIEAIVRAIGWHITGASGHGDGTGMTWTFSGTFDASRGWQTEQSTSRVYELGEPGITSPIITTEVRPEYTAETIKAKVAGNVKVSCVVATDGTVGDVTVTKALHPVLDQQAVIAAKKWRFKPGMKDGKPVPVRVELEMSFTVR
jgi:TonB family protein